MERGLLSPLQLLDGVLLCLAVGIYFPSLLSVLMVC